MVRSARSYLRLESLPIGLVQQALKLTNDNEHRLPQHGNGLRPS
jgi:hypothetical protein